MNSSFKSRASFSNISFLSVSLTILIFSILPIFSFAEEIELEQITIKKGLSQKASEASECFLSKDIEDIISFSLEEIIDNSPSIDLRKRSGFGIQQDVSLRGSIFEDNSITLQGIQINDPQTGHFSLEIPLTSADLEQIDIFKNSQRINFIPKRPKAKGFFLKTSFGQHALREQLLSFNFPLGKTKTRISSEHKISKASRQDTDFEIFNFSLHSLWEDETKDKEIEFLFGSTKKDFGADSFYASLFPHEEEHTNQRFFSLRSGLKKEPFRLDNIIYLRRHWDKYILDRHNPSFYTNYHTSYVYGFKSKFLSDNNLFFSFNIDRETIDSTNLNQHRRLKRGLSFGVQDKKIGKFIFDFLGGFDYYEKWKYLENFHFGLGHHLKEAVKLEFSFDRIWRAPSFTELYYNSPANRGDVNLDVQKSNNFEWTLRFFPNENLTSSLSFFLRNQSDTIDWVKNTSAAPWQARCVGDLDAYGFDVFSGIDFQDNLLRKFFLGYTYLNLNKDNAYRFSKYVFDYNRHKVVCMLGIHLKDFSVNLIGNFSKPVDREACLTFDLKLERKIRDFLLTLEGINIFDENYQEMQDIAGSARLVKMSLAYTF